MSTATMADFIPDGTVLNLRYRYSVPRSLLAEVEQGKAVVTVKVNGADISSQCFAFDQAAGYAEVYKPDSNGHFVITAKDGVRDICTKKIYGKVEVSIKQ